MRMTEFLHFTHAALSTMSKQQLVFHGFESVAWVAVLCLVLFAALFCVIVLFRYERQLIERKLGLLLLSLRVGVISLLGIILLEPVLAWTVDLERSGRIVVAVDVSRSMEAKDPQATKSEKLRVAQAIGLLRSDAPVDSWCTAYDAKQEPQWVAEREEPDSVRRRALNDSRREMAISAMQEVDRLSRIEIARRLLSAGEVPLLKELSRLGQVEVVVFAGKATPLDPGSLDQPLSPPGDTIGWEQTDLMQAIMAAPAERKGLKLAGVVLLSDGRENAHSTDTEYLKRFSGGVPIYPILVGSEVRPKDLSIASLDYPPTVFSQDKPVLKTTVRTSGVNGQEFGVTLEKLDADGLRIGDPIRKMVTANGASQEISFDLAAESDGRQRYRIRTDQLLDDMQVENNSREFSYQVVDDRANVLLIEGEGRWEFRYLHAALSRDERVDLSAVVFNQPYMGVLPDTFFPRKLSTNGLNSQSKMTPFEHYDLVVVGDVSPRDLPETTLIQLDRYVREEGGTLIVVAGKNAMPLAYNSPTLEGLLPVTKLRPTQLNDATQRRRPQDRGFHLELTPDGERQAMLQFSTNADENRKIWKELPGHPWGLAGEAKPGASVWTAIRSESASPGLDWERQNALFVQQFQGTGQVVWLGIDSTWRFRYRIGDLYHHRFWGQLSRWASEFKASAGNEFVRLGFERPVISEGEDAVVVARWDQRFLERFPNLSAQVLLKPAGAGNTHPAITVDLKADPEHPLVLTGRVPSLRASEYTVSLKAENAEMGDAPVVTELSVLEKLTPEMLDVSANRPLLEQIAQTTQGELYRINDAHRVTRKFQQVQESFSQRQEVPLWNHWFVFVLFCGLLMTEWVVRKMNGLP